MTSTTGNDKYAIIEEVATDWAILLADDPDDLEQKAQFEQWLKADPLHATAWARAKGTWDDLGELEAGTRTHWPKSATTRTSNASAFHKARPARTTVAAMAAAACLALTLLPGLMLRWQADYVTGTAEQQIITLNDGSTLTLAPESAVAVTYRDALRHINLLRGEGFFDVAPDQQRPFTVKAGNTTTTVLGTAFSVKKNETGVQVAVQHGQVKVTDQSTLTDQALKAGDRLEVTREQGARLEQLPTEQVARWRRHELVARDMPISELIDALRPYYNGIILVSDAFARQRITGLYRLDNPATTLEQLALAHDGKLQRAGPWLLRISQ